VAACLIKAAISLFEIKRLPECINDTITESKSYNFAVAYLLGGFHEKIIQ